MDGTSSPSLRPSSPPPGDSFAIAVGSGAGVGQQRSGFDVQSVSTERWLNAQGAIGSPRSWCSLGGWPWWPSSALSGWLSGAGRPVRGRGCLHADLPGRAGPGAAELRRPGPLRPGGSTGSCPGTSRASPASFPVPSPASPRRQRTWWSWSASLRGPPSSTWRLAPSASVGSSLPGPRPASQPALHLRSAQCELGESGRSQQVDGPTL